MPAAGYTPILLYGSANAGATPAAANLTNGTGGSEIAINITDGRLYYKDNNGAVQLIGAKLNSVLAAALASAPVGTGNVVLASGTVGTGAVVLASGTVGTGAVVLSSSAIVSAGAVAYSSDTTLTAANAGQMIFLTGTAASTFTLPSASALPAYAMKITIGNASGAPLTITPAAGDSYDLPVPVLQSDQQVILVNDGVAFWHTIAQNNGTTSPFVVGAAQTSKQAVNLGQAQSTFAALAGSATQAFSVANATAPTQAAALGQTIGNGDSNYTFVTRALSTQYQNTSARPLVVTVNVLVPSLSANGSAIAQCFASALVSGVRTNLVTTGHVVNMTGSTNPFEIAVQFIVPPSCYYEVTAAINAGSGSVSLLNWSEY